MKYITINVSFQGADVEEKDPTIVMRYPFLFPDLCSHITVAEAMTAMLLKDHPGSIIRPVGAGFVDMNQGLRPCGTSTTMNMGPAEGDHEVILLGPVNGSFFLRESGIL
jgi:hypothetical protein